MYKYKSNSMSTNIIISMYNYSYNCKYAIVSQLSSSTNNQELDNIFLWRKSLTNVIYFHLDHLYVLKQTKIFLKPHQLWENRQITFYHNLFR